MCKKVAGSHWWNTSSGPCSRANMRAPPVAFQSQRALVYRVTMMEDMAVGVPKGMAER